MILNALVSKAGKPCRRPDTAGKTTQLPRTIAGEEIAMPLIQAPTPYSDVPWWSPNPLRSRYSAPPLRASASFSAAARTPDRGLRSHGTASLSPVAKGRHESRAANRFGIVIGVEGGHWVGIRRSTRARWAGTSPPPASSGHPLLSLRKSALKQRRAAPSAYNSAHGMVRDGPR